MTLPDLSHDGFILSCGIPMLRDPAFEHSTIDQLNVATGCKGFGLFGEPPGGDNETAGSAFCSHGYGGPSISSLSTMSKCHD